MMVVLIALILNLILIMTESQMSLMHVHQAQKLTTNSKIQTVVLILLME